jgi:hypothetical protein
MRTFRDSAGRAWAVDLTIGAARRVRTLLGVDLLALTDGTPRLIDRLIEDLGLQIDVIYAIVKPQADAAGIIDEQWGQSLGGEAAAAAIGVFWEELVDFFHPLRPAMEQLARAARHLARAREELAAEIGRRILTGTGGEASGSSPASSASTRST